MAEARRRCDTCGWWGDAMADGTILRPGAIESSARCNRPGAEVRRILIFRRPPVTRASQGCGWHTANQVLGAPRPPHIPATSDA